MTADEALSLIQTAYDTARAEAAMTVADAKKFLLDDIIGRLDDTYELISVDYGDSLNSEQVNYVVRGDYENLFDSMSDWESEAQWYGAEYVLGQIVSSEELDWLNSGPRGLLGRSIGSEEKDAIIDEIRSRDCSSFIADLARNTTDVPLRIVAIDEDDAWSYEPISGTDALTKLGLPVTPDNIRIVEAALAECSPEFSVVMAYWYGTASVLDILNLGHDQEVVITDPHVFFGSPFAGSGWITDEPLTGQIVVARSDLRTDQDAFGYSIQDIFGQIVDVPMNLQGKDFV